MGRPGGPGPLDPIFDVPTQYGILSAGNNTPGVFPVTVTINKAAGQPDPADGGDVVYDVLFSQPVTGFTQACLSLSGTAGPTSAFIVNTGDDMFYQVSVYGMTATGTVIADVIAGCATSLIDGTLNSASTSTDNVVQWNLRAYAHINVGATQLDPTAWGPIIFDVVWNEAVSGFATGDVNLTSSTTGGTLVGTVTSLGDNIHFTVSVAGMYAEGDVIASINAGVCTAISSGLLNVASTSFDNICEYECDTSGVPWNHNFNHADTTAGVDGLGACFIQSDSWASLSPDGPYWRINANTMAVDGVNSRNSRMAEPQHGLAGPDLTVEVDMLNLHAVFTETSIWLRGDSDFQNCYFLAMQLNGFGGPDLQFAFQRVNAGVITTVAFVNIVGGASLLPFRLKVSAIGTALLVETGTVVTGAPWTTRLSTSDGSVATGYNVGFRRSGGSGFTENFDNLSIY